MKYSTNEWDTLKKVIVGVADHAKIPEMDKSLRTINYAGIQDVSEVKTGLYPKQVIDEANEDLEVFCNFLRGEGVEVLRPKREPTEYYNYCPRDSVFVHGDTAIATPQPLRSRRGNWRSFSQHVDAEEIPCSYHDGLYNEECVGDPSILALTELTPAFDAANIIRANDELLYLVSNSGNMSGANLLQKKLGDTASVRIVKDIYTFVHIDTTVAFLREGLLMVNPRRVKNRDQLPYPFNTWSMIKAPDPIDIGYYPGYNNASEWCNMNLFSVSPDLVVLEEHQHPTRKILETFGIECAMLPMRHQRTLSGGFHCVTLDLERECK
jgi:N-dimethylarginine dimethylaminohydrolase